MSSATFTYQDMILNLYWDTEPVRVANMLHDSKFHILDAHYMLRYHKSARIGHEDFSYNYDFTDPSKLVYSRENWSSEETHGVLMRTKREVLWSGHVRDFVKEHANPHRYYSVCMREDLHTNEKWIITAKLNGRHANSIAHRDRCLSYAPIIKNFEESKTCS